VDGTCFFVRSVTRVYNEEPGEEVGVRWPPAGGGG
jgi:hypothetical protein